MASVLATKDSRAIVSVKTPHGHNANLPEHQARAQFVPTVEVIRSYTANVQGNFSSYSEFLLSPEQLPDVCDKFTLQLVVPPVTVTGTTVVSFVNDASFLNRLIEISIGPELVASILPESGYINNVSHLDTETKFKVLPAMGNASLTARKAAALTTQTIFIDIPIPFVQRYGWLSKSHAQALRFRFYHADLASVVQTAGTAPVCSISSVSLNVSGRNYLNQANLTAVVANQRKLGHIDTRYVDPVQMQASLAAGSTQYTVQLTSLIGVFDSISFVVRLSSSVGTPLGNDPTAFVAVTSFNLKDSQGNLLTPEISSAYALGPLAAKFCKGDLTDINSGLGTTQKNIYTVNFGSRPEESLHKGTQHGFLRLDGLAKIQLTFPSSISASVVDVIGWQWANISADAGGLVKKTAVVA